MRRSKDVPAQMKKVNRRLERFLNRKKNCKNKKDDVHFLYHFEILIKEKSIQVESRKQKKNNPK
jgi:hypothetical protein